MKSRLWGAVSAALFPFVTAFLTSVRTIAHFVALATVCFIASTVNAAVIQRVNLDGSGLTTLVQTSFSTPHGVALDVENGQMYWTESSAVGRIHRANLDGSGLTELTATSYAQGIALNLGASHLYWVELFNDRILRANLDGSEVTNLVTGLNLPRGVALDVAGGHMYLTEFAGGTRGKIQRADLDGSGLTPLLEVGEAPFGLTGIALDVAGGQMYFTDAFDSVRRANLDGSGMTDLVTGLDKPWGIALDLAGGHMYWADPQRGEILRANLDGSGVTDLVTGLYEPWSVALDLDAGHIYVGATAVPLPASFWLFAPALASLGFVGLRRKKIS